MTLTVLLLLLLLFGYMLCFPILKTYITQYHYKVQTRITFL
jgi:hypothetical protein